jgi:hypothetical protein
MDIVDTPPEFKDFFGVQTPNPGVTRIRCPLLVFLGTNEDVGNEEDLEILKGRFGWQFTQIREQGRDASSEKPSPAPNP